ncbi:MAG: 50S ribosomal protein L25 [Desulfobulbaceae bacterium]|nr:MAG: 50S ribosomal protein L25 [Desulfobulbaceae bacterium]
MITKEIATSIREVFGKGPVRRLRGEGKTPGVVYSGGDEAIALEFETKTLFQELLDIQGRNAVITLKIDDGSEKNVLVKEIQTDPLKDTLFHADFLEIDLQKSVQFKVPLVYVGKAKGEDFGGITQIDKTSLVVEGKPLDIPDDCVINVTDLGIGDKITAADVSLPDGVSLISNSEMVCVSVSAP